MSSQNKESGSPPVGLALAGGSGLRARPLTLASPDYRRSKAAIRLAGRSLIDWEVGALARQGVTRLYVVANGRENRAQTRLLLGDGERHGVSVRYSRPRFDAQNTGSGQATLRALEHWELDGPVLVFPTDSLFDFSLDALVAAHREQGAVVTVATVARTPREAARKYGVLRLDGQRVLGFREKPEASEAEAIAREAGRGDGLVDVNAGMYLVDGARLRALAGTPRLTGLARTRLDWGGDLLPYLVEQGEPVAAHRIARFGDLGAPADYLETLGDLLRGRFPLLADGLGPALDAAGSVRIHDSSLRRPDPATGLTLAQKLEAGIVRIGPHVRIGRDVEIGPGAWIEDSDVGDGVDLGAGVVLRGSACADHAIVGTGARLVDAFVGFMAVVDSTADRRTVLSGHTALGDEARIEAGARLHGVHVYPGVRIAADTPVPPGSVFEATPARELAAVGEGVH